MNERGSRKASSPEHSAVPCRDCLSLELRLSSLGFILVSKTNINLSFEGSQPESLNRKPRSKAAQRMRLAVLGLESFIGALGLCTGPFKALEIFR